MFLGEVMEVKGVKGVKTYVLQLNNYAKKTYCLNSFNSFNFINF